jgi:hypothetical protein
VVSYRSAESGPKHGTKQQTCADETYNIRREMKHRNNKRHRHAKDENSEAIKQRAAGR